MVGKVVLDQSIGHCGQEIRIMVVHMHNVLANNQWGPTKLKAFWGWRHGLCVEHEVDVLMGDFNTSFVRVIPELRSRGATLDLAAWYPWENKLGIPSADSCGIFCLRKPGVYQLKVGLPDIHKKENRLPLGVVLSWCDGLARSCGRGRRGRACGAIRHPREEWRSWPNAELLPSEEGRFVGQTFPYPIPV